MDEKGQEILVHRDEENTTNIGDNMNLSENFTLEQMIKSDTAKRNNIDNSPLSNGELFVINNLEALCKNTLEPINTLLKKIYTTSGYRCKKLNDKVGSSDISQHRLGKACDFVPGCIVEDAFQKIKASNIPFDQLIQENDEWIHVSYDKDKKVQRRMVLKMAKENGILKYIPG